MELFKLTVAQGEATSTTPVVPVAIQPTAPEAAVDRMVLAALEVLALGQW